MAIAAVFFDFDDTLHDFAAAYERALRRAAEVACAAVPGGGPAPAAVHAASRQAWGEAFARWTAGEIDEDTLWRSRAEAVMRAAGAPQRADLADQVVRAYQSELAPGAELFPDALPALQALDAARPRPFLGLVTNGPDATQRARLARLGLAERFDLVLTSGEAGAAKPDPAIFHLALARAGAPAADAVMVGDDPGNDIAGAGAVGLRTLWLNRRGATWPPERRPGPTVVVADLHAAVAWILRAMA